MLVQISFINTSDALTRIRQPGGHVSTIDQTAYANKRVCNQPRPDTEYMGLDYLSLCRQFVNTGVTTAKERQELTG